MDITKDTIIGGNQKKYGENWADAFLRYTHDQGMSDEMWHSRSDKYKIAAFIYQMNLPLGFQWKRAVTVILNEFSLKVPDSEENWREFYQLQIESRNKEDDDDSSLPELAERDDSTISSMSVSDDDTIASSSSDSSASSGMPDLMVYMESEDSSFSSEEASEMMASLESYDDNSTASSESSGEVAERIIILDWDQVVRPTSQETEEWSNPIEREIMGLMMNEYQAEQVDISSMYTGEDIEDGNPYMMEEDPEVVRYNYRMSDDKYPYVELEDPDVQRDLIDFWNDDMSIEQMPDRDKSYQKF